MLMFAQEKSNLLTTSPELGAEKLADNRNYYTEQGERKLLNRRNC
jgi:hypothetical protein